MREPGVGARESGVESGIGSFGRTLDGAVLNRR